MAAWVSQLLNSQQGRAREALARVILDLALRIIDHARDHGRVAIGDAVTLTGASRIGCLWVSYRVEPLQRLGFALARARTVMPEWAST